MNRLLNNSYFVGAALGIIIGFALLAALFFVFINPRLSELGNMGEPDQGLINNPNALTVVPGGSPIDKETNEVLNQFGGTADNSAEAGSPDAPHQSDVVEEDDLPPQAVKMSASMENGFNPNLVTVKRGQIVTLALASGDGKTYILRFDDPELKAIAVGVTDNQVRAITFNAPDKAGRYSFFSDVPGHAQAGLRGELVVN